MAQKLTLRESPQRGMTTVADSPSLCSGGAVAAGDVLVPEVSVRGVAFSRIENAGGGGKGCGFSFASTDSAAG